MFLDFALEVNTQLYILRYSLTRGISYHIPMKIFFVSSAVLEYVLCVLLPLMYCSLNLDLSLR